MNKFSVISKNIRQHFLSTLLTIVSIALGVALVVSISNIKNQVKSHFYDVSSRCELVVGAKGSPMSLVLNSIYFISQPVGNIDYKYYDDLKENPLIKFMIPLAMGDKYNSSLIVGTTSDFFRDLNPLTKKQLTFSNGDKFMEPFQAVLGASVTQSNKLKVGDKFVSAHGVSEIAEPYDHQNSPYKVVGILNKTNTPVDKTIFVDIRSIWLLHGENKTHNETDEQFYASDIKLNDLKKVGNKKIETDLEDLSIDEIIKDTENFRKDQLRSKYSDISYINIQDQQITSILVKLASPSYILEIQNQININSNFQAVIPALEIQKLLSYLGSIDSLLLIISYLVILVAIISVFISIYNFINSRIREIAIFRVIGASRGWIISVIFSEIAIICLNGWLLGVIMGHILIFILAPITLSISGVNLVQFDFGAEELLLLPILILMGILSGIYPAINAYKVNVVSILCHRQ